MHLHYRFAGLLLLVGLGLTMTVPAHARCRSSVFDKTHVWSDVDGDGSLSVDDTFDYTIVMCHGGGNRRCQFEDVVPPELSVDPMSVMCMPDSGPSPDICEYDGLSSSILMEYVDNMDADACVTVTFSASIARAPVAALCNQARNTLRADDLSRLDCESADFPYDLELSKTTPTPSVLAADAVNFEIEIHNTSSTGAASDIDLIDSFEDCFEPLGVEGDACDPGIVSCAGEGCGDATCTYATGGLGFSFSGLNLAPDDGAAGGPDAVTIRVAGAAGTSAGLCTNTAETSAPGSPSIIETAEVDITLAPGPVLKVDKTTAVVTAAPGDAVEFTITVSNIGGAALTGGALIDSLDTCYDALGIGGDPCDSALVSCSGSGCTGTVCSYAATGQGFTLGVFDLTANDSAAGGDDEIVITVIATAGMTEGLCVNDAEAADTAGGVFALDSAEVEIVVPRPELDLVKEAAVTSVVPGGTVDFTISIANTGGAALAAADLADTLDACFEPLGVAGAACDAALVSCTGTGCAGASCVYSAGGLGFIWSGLTLTANDGVVGGDDELVVSVTATAGTRPGPCVNEAEARGGGTDADDDAEVESLAPEPELAINKDALSPAVLLGGSVDFSITLSNVGGASLVDAELRDSLEACFEPLGVEGDPCDPGIVSCAGTGCVGSVCSYGIGGLGFDVTGVTLAAADGTAGGDDEVVFTVTVTAGMTEGPCSNSADARGDGALHSDAAEVDIVSVLLDPDLTITKTADRTTVAPGGAVEFTITLTNIGAGALLAGDLSDVMEACFEPLGSEGAVCDSSTVSCAGSGCAGLTCSYGLAGLGFDASGFTLAADDGAAGGDDEIVFSINAIAGATETTCGNEAETSDPDSPLLSDRVEVDITTAAPTCDLMQGDITFPPRTPGLATLYTTACGPGADRLSSVHTADVGPGELPDAYTGPGGNLRLYQIECGCADDLVLTKNLVSGNVVLAFR